jgi:hypothetical protein
MRSETTSTKKLAKKLSTPVTIRRTAHGGKLEIGFNNENHLEKLIKLLLNI